MSANSKIRRINIMTIKPLFDKVVVEGLKAEEKTKSGLYLTAASQEKPATCVVVAVGPGGIIDRSEEHTSELQSQR